MDWWGMRRVEEILGIEINKVVMFVGDMMGVSACVSGLCV